MKIAVSACDPSLEAQVDPRFGRASYFLLVDPETLDLETVPNRPHLQAAQGAGIQAAALVARYRPTAVLTGHCGPKAFHTLQAAGIRVIVGVTGTVREALARYQTGELQPSPGPDVQGHW